MLRHPVIIWSHIIRNPIKTFLEEPVTTCYSYTKISVGGEYYEKQCAADTAVPLFDVIRDFKARMTLDFGYYDWLFCQQKKYSLTVLNAWATWWHIIIYEHMHYALLSTYTHTHWHDIIKFQCCSIHWFSMLIISYIKNISAL